MRESVKKIINKINAYFRSKSAEQVFTLSLLMGCVSVMLFCAIVRLCGGLWFTADLESVPIPNEFWQDRIMNALFIFELTFVYKILCRTQWIWCILIAIAQTIIIEFIPSETIANVVNLVLYVFIPFCFIRQWQTIMDSIILYGVCILYSAIFFVGRIGHIDASGGYNFIYSVVGSIDYKIFIVTMFLIQKYFGGIRLWKNQKRLILAKSPKMNAV